MYSLFDPVLNITLKSFLNISPFVSPPYQTGFLISLAFFIAPSYFSLKVWSGLSIEARGHQSFLNLELQHSKRLSILPELQTGYEWRILSLHGVC